MKFAIDVFSIVAVLAGALMIYVGDMDDAPGFGGLGFVLIFLVAASIIRRELQAQRAKSGPQNDA